MSDSPLSLSQAIPSWDNPTLQGFDEASASHGQRISGSKGRQYVRFYSKTFREVVAKKVKINEKTGTTTVLETEPKDFVREMVHIVTPGEKNVFEDKACDYHKREFWPQYVAFRDGKTAPLGTSLDECTFISPGVALELRYLRCETVEQLADASDLLCNQIPDGHMLREFARQQCKVNLDNQNITQVNIMKAELEKSQEIIKAMQEQMNEMKGMILDAKGKEILPAAKAPTKPEGVRNV